MIGLLVIAAFPVTAFVVVCAFLRLRWAWWTLLLAVPITLLLMQLDGVEGSLSWLFQFSVLFSLPIALTFALLRKDRKLNEPASEGRISQAPQPASTDKIGMVDARQPVLLEERRVKVQRVILALLAFFCAMAVLLKILVFLLEVLDLENLQGTLGIAAAIGSGAIITLISANIIRLFFRAVVCSQALIVATAVMIALAVLNRDESLSLAICVSCAASAFAVSLKTWRSNAEFSPAVN